MMQSLEQWTGRTAIVTGAEGGIGSAIVRAFCDAGVRVLAVDRPGGGASALSSLAGVRSLRVDITDEHAPEEMVACCVKEFGGLDIVVNNAGIVIAEPFESLADAAWEQTLAVNTTAVMRISRAAVPNLKARGRGRIINIGSTSSAFAAAEHASYCASKHAVAGLSKAMALDLGKYGITVNYVMPGFIATPMASDNYDPALIEAWRAATALGRIGNPDDIAGVVLFLASEQSRYMTGAALVVDGGHSLHE
jgi:NAD(P)-dependent dehydrogenase (short-subunit alcohol dehydrogenase family)